MALWVYWDWEHTDLRAILKHLSLTFLAVFKRVVSSQVNFAHYMVDIETQLATKLPSSSCKSQTLCSSNVLIDITN